MSLSLESRGNAYSYAVSIVCVVSLATLFSYGIAVLDVYDTWENFSVILSSYAIMFLLYIHLPKRALALVDGYYSKIAIFACLAYVSVTWIKVF